MEQFERSWKGLLENLLHFVFPTNQDYPHTGARLFAWAEFGPSKFRNQLNTLPGGFGPDARLLLPFELKLLLDDVVSQFLVELYTVHGSNRKRHGAFTQPELGDIKTHCNPEAWRALDFTVSDVTDLALRAKHSALADLERGPVNVVTGPNLINWSAVDAGPGSKVETACRVEERLPEDPKKLAEHLFTLVSMAILKERRRRIGILRTRPEKACFDKRAKFKQAEIYNRSTVKPFLVQSWSSPKDVVRSLHRAAFAISDVSQGPGAACDITQNVRLLRDERPPAQDKEGWDNYCCTRQKGMSRRILKTTV
eukprot:NODE_2728_length_1133_cov_37.493542_g2505_i0.p1 GENE.NODE_2728_length_1133_cov_37.493542_g2505_i0~~NODE_2728_length_1133_cov_37.493542_g2505_i0.p1  ORF type:complete len:310 (+),score=46.84 NODE_2728_length_1133_cov_37.493542_g2505_i0:63-992(+)